jgi:hypothetical protein
LDYPLPPNFFGPTHSWKEAFLEEAFLLQRHLGMDYQTVRSLPIRYRRWFLERLIKDFEQRNQAAKGQPASNQSASENMDKLSKFEEMMSNKFK